jgi:outer membrane protein assembly factor BamB
MKGFRLRAAAALVGAGLTVQAHANWPQWCGPLLNGVAPDSAPPTSWGEDKNVKWKVKIPGKGSATPVIWKDKVFVVTAIAAPGETPAATAAAAPRPDAPTAGDEGGRRQRGGGAGGGGGFGGGEKPTAKVQFTVMALDRKTGKVVWQKIAREAVPHEGHHPRDGTFASGSPVTDGEHLYVSFGSHGIYCYDLDGNLKWEKDLGDMRTRNSFGEGASPALHGDTLVVNWDHEGEDFVVALDKRTGQERWRQSRDEPTSWSTPLILEHDGRTQVVVSATNRVRSYDLATGKQIWETGGMTANVIPTPVAGFGMVFPISGYRGAALLAVKLGAQGTIDGTDSIAWRHNKSTPYVPSPLLAGERLYFIGGNNGLISCFNAKTGQPYFEAERLTDLGGGVYASPVAAGEHVYVVGRDGKAVVLKIGDKFEVVASNRLDERMDASPAIVGKEMFLRGQQSLYCISES